MSATKVKKSSHESQDPRSPSGGHKKSETPSKGNKANFASAGMDLDHSDSIGSHTTPSKKKHGETHGKSKAELILEKSPSLIKSMGQKTRSNLTSPKNDSTGRHHGPTPTKSPSASKISTKDDSSDDEDAMAEKLRAMDAAEAERSKNASSAATAASAADSDSDDDAPVAKSFKDMKKDHMELHQAEQEDARMLAAKKKEMRRQRTQKLQEQSKKTSKKEKKKRVETSSEDESGSEMDVDDFELLPDTVLKQAASQTNTHLIIEDDQEQRMKIERRKQRKLEREIERQERINSKLVTVMPLTDSSGNLLQQSRKAASQSAESFLKDHFWGGRLERMPADHYISERVRGPAYQFVVPKTSIVPPRKTSMKETRRAELAKRRR